MDYKEKVIALLSNQELSKEQKEKLELIFPELKESEDERIKKWIIDDIRYNINNESLNNSEYKKEAEKAIAWLEKQGDYDRLIEEMRERKELLFKEKEKATSSNDKLSLGGRIAMLQELLAFNICNTTDKIEPKFKVGDWIVDDEAPNDVFCVIEVLGEIYKVIDIDGDDYHIPHCKVDKQFHLWTIQDTKDGDVLVASDGSIFLFAGVVDCACKYYVALTTDNNVEINKKAKGGYWETSRAVHPATKEQRDLLFKKMKEAGYEWDNEKKELMKIDAYQLSENPCSNCTNTKGCITCVNGDLKSTATPRILLNSNEVIEWLDENCAKFYDSPCNPSRIIKQFKKDFGL